MVTHFLNLIEYTIILVSEKKTVKFMVRTILCNEKNNVLHSV